MTRWTRGAVVVAIVFGIGSAEAAAQTPAEAGLITTTTEIIEMTRARFAKWCRAKGQRPQVALDLTDSSKATCAWLDRRTGRVWHTALHFDARSTKPFKADVGLLFPSNDTLRGLIRSRHGERDGETVGGDPLWRIDVDGRVRELSVVEYEELTLVQLRHVKPAVAMR